MSFEAMLKRGHEAEVAVARWLQRKGWTVYRALDTDFAPKLEGLVLPDLLCFGPDGLIWIEVKHHGTAPLNRTHGAYRRDYLEGQLRSGAAA